MSITAKQLEKLGAHSRDIATVTHEQLQIIDNRLKTADRTWGKNTVEYELPTVVPIPGLVAKDAQRIVYSSIIRSLQDRGFEVRLLMVEDLSLLIISWVTAVDDEELRAMNEVIKSVRIERKDYDVIRAQAFRASVADGGGAVSRRRARAPPRDPRALRPPPSVLPRWAAERAPAPPPSASGRQNA